MDNALREIQAINQQLLAFLQALEYTEPSAPRPEQIEELLAAVQRGGACLRRRVSPPFTSEMKQEYAQFRGALEKLLSLLAKLEKALLIEKARLDGQRAHLAAANRWASTSRQTF